jgi:APA family basic amino acid/polyamine antiporter
MTFFFINLSLIKLRWDLPGAPRTFRVPLYTVTPLAGIVSCTLLFTYLSQYAILFGAIWLAIDIFAFEVRLKKEPEENS